MARKKLNFIKFLQSNYLLLVGVLLMSLFAGWRYYQARILSFNTNIVSQFKTSGIKPIHIKSYPVGVDIDIKDATIDKNGVWAINPNSANYLINSAAIGDNGNIIIYGHNKDNIMGPIRHIKVGALIEILGSDGLNYKYEVVKTDIVDPDNLSYIKETNTDTLTLYTCTGFLDSKRFIVVAKKMN
jgi:LPXTG-site transpeptidase (sortase) family protein